MSDYINPDHLPDDVVDVEVLVPVTMEAKGGGDVRVPPYNKSSLL